MELKEQIELLNRAKERKEETFLYNLTKVIAESDSIGEQYGYCLNYDINKFRGEAMLIREDINHRVYTYLDNAGLAIYKIYLLQVKTLEKKFKKELELC